MDEKKTFHVKTREDWRQWLEENHHIEQSVWLICNTKKSNLPSVSWSELVDEALCFGWTDSTRKTLDEGSFIQLFSRRKPGSTWSKINKEKVQKLIENNLMMKAGFETIRMAKRKWLLEYFRQCGRPCNPGRSE